ncbi:MAG TPA: hypothetical protein VLB73_05120 [Patescibacteria group bacterium]|nr:hypothetical protein [Patescibacteria group bacterium]
MARHVDQTPIGIGQFGKMVEAMQRRAQQDADAKQREKEASAQEFRGSRLVPPPAPRLRRQ